MGDCPARLLVLPRHLSSHWHAEVGVCTEGDRHLRDGVHFGQLLEVDGDRVIERHAHTEWTDDHPGAFVRPEHLRHGFEPAYCNRETWVPGARCALPAMHDPWECQP